MPRAVSSKDRLVWHIFTDGALNPSKPSIGGVLAVAKLELIQAASRAPIYTPLRQESPSESDLVDGQPGVAGCPRR